MLKNCKVINGNDKDITKNTTMLRLLRALQPLSGWTFHHFFTNLPGRFLKLLSLLNIATFFTKSSTNLANLCDLFGMVKWSFKRLSDLQLVDRRITLTLNHLDFHTSPLGTFKTKKRFQLARVIPKTYVVFNTANDYRTNWIVHCYMEHERYGSIPHVLCIEVPLMEEIRRSPLDR